MILDLTEDCDGNRRCDDNRGLSDWHALMACSTSHPDNCPISGIGAPMFRRFKAMMVTQSNSSNTQGAYRSSYDARTCGCTCTECRNADYEMGHSGHCAKFSHCRPRQWPGVRGGAGRRVIAERSTPAWRTLPCAGGFPRPPWRVFAKSQMIVALQKYLSVITRKISRRSENSPPPARNSPPGPVTRRRTAASILSWVTISPLAFR